MERWARRGVVFENAVAPSSYTLTSHASMFTGRYPHELSADWCTPLERSCPTLAEVLSARGYMTAGFVGNKLNAGRQTGLERGFAHFEAHRLIFGEFLDRSGLCRSFCEMPPVRTLFDCYEDRWGRVAAEEVNRRFLGWLEGQTPGQPYFAFLNYVDCHTVYLPRTSFARPDQPFPREAKQKSFGWTMEAFMRQDMPPDYLPLVLDAYDACLRELDGRVNELLTELQTADRLRNTIVIILSDHGEQFGEHGLVQHADSLYRPAVHVPLVVLHPKNAAGKRVRDMVTLRDLPATILDLLGMSSAGLPGDSFAGAIAAGSTAGLSASTPKFAFMGKGINFPDWHPNARDSVKAVFLEGKHYIKSDKQEELYDFETDLEEKNNLAGTESARLLLERCRLLAAPQPATE
jgi:arylsulfatase A-like enzyme